MPEQAPKGEDDRFLFEQHPDIRGLHGLDRDSNFHPVTQASIELFGESLKVGNEFLLDDIANQSSIRVTTTSGHMHEIIKDDEGSYFRKNDLDPEFLQEINIIGASANGSLTGKIGPASVVLGHDLLFQDKYCFRDGTADDLPPLFNTLVAPEDLPEDELRNHIDNDWVRMQDDGKLYWNLANFLETHYIGPIVDMKVSPLQDTL